MIWIKLLYLWMDYSLCKREIKESYLLASINKSVMKTLKKKDQHKLMYNKTKN